MSNKQITRQINSRTQGKKENVYLNDLVKTNDLSPTDFKLFEDSIPLNQEQNNVLNQILTGKSVFLTGTTDDLPF